MAVIHLTEKELIGQDNPVPMLKRVSDWHQLKGKFELLPGSSRSEYKVSGTFPSDEVAIEFLVRLFEDEEYAMNIWRQQP